MLDEGITPRIHKRIQARVKRGPSKTDGYGHIYVYELKSDEPGMYYKIGRTARSVDKRLSKWKDSCLVSSYRVEHNKMAEFIIHAYLDDARVYRYDRNYVIWKSNGVPVLGGPVESTRGKKKEIEWFRCTFERIDGLMQQIRKGIYVKEENG
jgi:hypothetical protein